MKSAVPVVLALVLAACSSGGASLLPTSGGSQATIHHEGALLVSLAIPAGDRATRVAVTISGDGGSPGTFALRRGGRLFLPRLAECADGSNCYAATVTTYDASGRTLATLAQVPFTIAAGRTNAIGFTTSPAVASIVFVSASPFLTTGTNGFGMAKCAKKNAGINVFGVSAAGNYIVGAGAPAVKLASNDPQLVVAKTTTATPNLFLLKPQGIPNGNSVVALTANVGARHSKTTVTFSGDICGVLTEFTIPSKGSGVFSIAGGPDGALWFAESGTSKIGRITTNGKIQEVAVSSGNPPFMIAAGPDKALWFTENSTNNIGRMTTTGAQSEFAIKTPMMYPNEIVTGPDGAMWYGEGGGAVGRINTKTHVMTEFKTTTTPYAVTIGPDNNIWFTDENASLGYFASGKVTLVPMNAGTIAPVGIATGPDGAIWAADNAGYITRFAGSMTEIPVPTSPSAPNLITAGPDGAMWFTEGCGEKIGRVTTGPTPKLTEPFTVANGSGPFGITTGPDGAIWFTELYANKIGRIQ